MLLFKDRDDAGLKLAQALKPYQGQDLVVLGIPRGGIVIAYHIATELEAPMDALVVRKISIPWSPEAGFGAVGPDGSVIFNEEMLPYLGISQGEADRLAEEVYGEIQRRMKVYRGDKPWPALAGKTVILADDGLATGITTLAAVQTVRNQSPVRLIVAVPVASGSGYNLVKPHVDDMVCLYTHPEDLPFAVAAFYRKWSDMTDAEVIEYLSRPANGHPGPEQVSAS